MTYEEVRRRLIAYIPIQILIHAQSFARDEVINRNHADIPRWVLDKAYDLIVAGIPDNYPKLISLLKKEKQFLVDNFNTHPCDSWIDPQELADYIESDEFQLGEGQI